MREFNVTAYRWLSERVEVPLLVGETSDGSHLNTADFIASGCATYVRTSANHRGGITGASGSHQRRSRHRRNPERNDRICHRPLRLRAKSALDLVCRGLG